MTEELANPAPLGLMGFGMTTVLLNLHNVGLFSLGAMIISMGILYGGIAQVIAGIMEYKKGNTFGTVAFTSFGLFWISLALINILPNTTFWTTAAEPYALGSYLLMWGIFALFMFVGSLKSNRVLQFVFLAVTVLFFLLAIEEYTQIPIIKVIAGYEGILCGSSAIYLAMAEVINEAHEKTILPIGNR